MVTVIDRRRLNLPAVPSSVGAARRFVRQVLLDGGLEDAVDVTTLLVSELATNAVLHARTDFAVEVSADREGVRVEVLDGSDVPAQHRQNSNAAATGRGVAMVDRLASSWGSYPASARSGFAKGVWFTVPLAGAADSAWAGDWLDGL